MFFCVFCVGINSNVTVRIKFKNKLIAKMQGEANLALLNFEQLVMPELNEMLLQQLDQNIKGKGWSITYQCITMIRAICKFYPQHIPDIFGKYGMVLLELFNNSATQNIKNLIKLLSEIFEQGQNINIETLVSGFLPAIIKRAATESTGQLKQACQQLMTIISNRCCYPRVIEVSTELSVDKNVTISEMALKLLSVLIMNIGNSLTQINPNTLQMLMRGMSFLINGKRNNMKTSALDVCVFIYNQIGSENFLQLLNYSLSQEEVNVMGNAMQTHRIQKKTSSVEEIKQLKQQNRNYMRQSGQFNDIQNQNFYR